MDKVALALLKPVNEVVTYLLGAYTVLWGLWLAAPWWDVFSSAMLYSGLVQLLPETVWGLIAIGAGFLTLAGLIKHLPRTFIFGAGAAGLHWFVIGLFYFLGDPTNTGGITAVFLSILATYIYLNVKINRSFGDNDDFE